MTFINVSLLLGGVFLALPILLHLLMRQQPKRLTFPPVRLIKARLETNRRTLNLRHRWLLFLRAAVVLCLALALARPSISGGPAAARWIVGWLAGLALLVGVLWLAARRRRSSRLVGGGLGLLGCLLLLLLAWTARATWAGGAGPVLGQQQMPVAAVMVLDTSPRMEYRYQNETRLARAQALALDLLRQLPSGSQVAVMEGRSPEGVFSVDAAAAQKALQRLRVVPAPVPLAEQLPGALRLLRTAEQQRKELYVFTDLAAAAWGSATAQLPPQLEAAPDVSLYIVDVGVPQPQDLALAALRLSSETVSQGGELTVAGEVRRLGPAADVHAELFLEDPDPTRPLLVDGRAVLPEARRRAQELVSLPADGGAPVSFQLRGLPPGIHHGYVKLAVDDALAVTDAVYFTVEVREAWPVLIVAPPEAAGGLVAEALAPAEFVRTGQARFHCDVSGPDELAQRSLADYAAVCLLDPPPLPEPAWQAVDQYVQQGGGLALFLGHQAQPLENFQTPLVQQLAGGRLLRQWRTTERELFLAPRSYEHPLLAEFRSVATSVPWDRLAVFRHWELAELSPEVRVVLPFSNGRPAILEHSRGRGTVLVATTPFSEPARPSGRPAWNELFSSDNAWPTLVLVNEMLLYLAQQAETQLNYVAGEPVVLANDAQRDPERYEMFTPEGTAQELQARRGRLVIRFAEAAGTYRLKGTKQGIVKRGFSVNLPDSAGDLRRLTEEELDALLGEDRYQLAHDLAEIEREVGEMRLGQEFFPYLVLTVALLLALEQLLASRFYPPDRAPSSLELRQVA